MYEMTRARIKIQFQAIGNAHILKQNKYFIEKTYNVHYVIAFLKSKLVLFDNITLHIKDNTDSNIYFPKMNEIIRDLYNKFNVNEELIIYYSYPHDTCSEKCDECNWLECKCGNKKRKYLKENIEKLIINSKIISSIKEGDKLITNSDDIFQVDHPYMIQSVKRWWEGSNRINNLYKLNSFINKVVDSLSYLIDNYESHRKEYNIIIFLKTVPDMITGLSNLRDTYFYDNNICESINNLIVQLEDKLIYINF